MKSLGGNWRDQMTVGQCAKTIMRGKSIAVITGSRQCLGVMFEREECYGVSLNAVYYRAM